MLVRFVTDANEASLTRRNNRQPYRKGTSMLVLSTRLNEKIFLPDSNTAIEVVAIQSNTVRLGISAPEDVRILRENVHDKVAEWGPEPVPEDRVPTLQDVTRPIDKRLEIA